MPGMNEPKPKQAVDNAIKTAVTAISRALIVCFPIP